MFKRILIQGLLFSTAQIIFFILLLNFIAVISEWYNDGTTVSQLAITLSQSIFAILVFIANTVSALISHKSTTTIITLLVAVLYSCLWVEDISLYPVCSLLMIGAGFAGFMLRLYLHYKFPSTS